MPAFVWAYNPATGGVARHSEQAHDELWSRLGFERVDVDLDVASQELATPFGDAAQLPEDYVRAVASRRAPAPPLDEGQNGPPRETPTPTRRPTTPKEA
jgi:hypothetical protein